MNMMTNSTAKAGPPPFDYGTPCNDQHLVPFTEQATWLNVPAAGVAPSEAHRIWNVAVEQLLAARSTDTSKAA